MFAPVPLRQPGRCPPKALRSGKGDWGNDPFGDQISVSCHEDHTKRSRADRPISKHAAVEQALAPDKVATYGPSHGAASTWRPCR